MRRRQITPPGDPAPQGADVARNPPDAGQGRRRLAGGGTILGHFGITAEQVMRELGLSADRVEDYARKGFAWAWPTVLLGALVIVPIWFLVYLLRPPGQSSSD